jgi:hypothetical protein
MPLQRAVVVRYLAWQGVSEGGPVRNLLSLVATIAAVVALILIPRGSASAIGGEQLECNVGPFVAWSNHCVSHQPARTADIMFRVFGENGSGYSFAWTLQGTHGAIIGGCASSTDYCELTSATASDHEIVGTVVISQNGASETLSATAEVFAVCTADGRLVWC